jgi:hypothetical protein
VARQFGIRYRRQTPPILRFKPDPIFGTWRRSSSEARTQELRRLCPLFAERAQEGGKPTIPAREKAHVTASSFFTAVRPSGGVHAAASAGAIARS